MIRTEQKILFVKIICQASFDISVFRYRYQSIVDKINSQKPSKVQKITNQTILRIFPM